MRPPSTNGEPGLAAVKHGQQVAERAALAERQEKAHDALVGAMATAHAEWSEDMRRANFRGAGSRSNASSGPRGGAFERARDTGGDGRAGTALRGRGLRQAV